MKSILLGCLPVILSPGWGHAADFPEQIQKISIHGTVQIINRERGASGNGVILGRKDKFTYILTASHLVSGAKKFQISACSGKSGSELKPVAGSVEVLHHSKPIVDLALIRMETKEAIGSVLSICSSSAIPTTENFKAWSVGRKSEKTLQLVTRTVVKKQRARRSRAGEVGTFWLLKQKNQHGDSGGPLLDKQGKLIGIASGNSRSGGYFIHTSEIRAFLKMHKYQWLAGK